MKKKPAGKSNNNDIRFELVGQKLNWIPGKRSLREPPEGWRIESMTDEKIGNLQIFVKMSAQSTQRQIVTISYREVDIVQSSVRKTSLLADVRWFSFGRVWAVWRTDVWILQNDQASCWICQEGFIAHTCQSSFCFYFFLFKSWCQNSFQHWRSKITFSNIF